MGWVHDNLAQCDKCEAYTKESFQQEIIRMIINSVAYILSEGGIIHLSQHCPSHDKSLRRRLGSLLCIPIHRRLAARRGSLSCCLWTLQIAPDNMGREPAERSFPLPLADPWISWIGPSIVALPCSR